MFRLWIGNYANLLAAATNAALDSMKTTEQKEGCGDTAAEHAQNCRPAPKRAIVVNDQLFPMPGRHVKVAAIKEQAGIPKDHALIRDHNSPHDVIMPENGTADLAEGTVFYSMPACDIDPRPGCEVPAKRVIDVGDRWEIVVKPDQSGRFIRDLFNLPDEVELLKDFESPNDEVIGDDTALNLADGEVFCTRKRADLLTIIVNKKSFNSTQGVKLEMTGLESRCPRCQTPARKTIRRSCPLFPARVLAHKPKSPRTPRLKSRR